MAEKLIKYYIYVENEKGLSGKIKLATITKISSVKAAIEPDSEENISKFKDAIIQLTGKPAPTL